eukprot:5909993-Pyramimonas_sp.AAC.1
MSDPRRLHRLRRDVVARELKGGDLRAIGRAHLEQGPPSCQNIAFEHVCDKLPPRAQVAGDRASLFPCRAHA